MGIFFQRNEHNVDRILRIAIGIAALSLVFVGPKTLWGLLGLIPLVTGAVGTCPVYSLLGISSCPINTKTQRVT